MLNQEKTIRRYIAEYSKKSDELLNEYDCIDFDLEKFKTVFEVLETSSNPMLDCYLIKEDYLDFLKRFTIDIHFNFKDNIYFLESMAQS